MRQILGRTLGSIAQLYGSLEEEQKLRLEHADLLDDISLGIKVTVLTTQLNLLVDLLQGRGAPDEVRNLASRITMSQKRSLPWEKKILSLLIKIKLNEVSLFKYKWTKASAKIRKILTLEQFRKYSEIKKLEIDRAWSEGKQNCREKFAKFTRNIPLLEDVEGIPNQDVELIRIYGDEPDEGLVLGGIEATPEIKAFLRLDPKFKVFQRLDLHSHETEAETLAFKQRISRKEDQGEAVDQEQRILFRAEVHRARVPYKPGEVNFAKYKAGDTGFTKTICQLPSLPEAEETAVQNQKLKVMEAMEETKQMFGDQAIEMCILTATEKEGRKQII